MCGRCSGPETGRRAHERRAGWAPGAVGGFPAGERAPGHDRLAERYDKEREQWVEVYGQKVQFTFGLDLYAPPKLGEGAMQAALDQLAGACAGAGPEGLDIREFSCGETGYDRDSRLLKRPAQAVCTACLYAVTEPGGAFLDFEVRGESHQ